MRKLLFILIFIAGSAGAQEVVNYKLLEIGKDYVVNNTGRKEIGNNIEKGVGTVNYINSLSINLPKQITGVVNKNKTKPKSKKMQRVTQKKYKNSKERKLSRSLIVNSIENAE